MSQDLTSTTAAAADVDDDTQDAAAQGPGSSPPADDPAAEPKAPRRAANAARTKATPLEADASSAKAPGPTASDDGAKRPRSSSARTRTEGSKTDMVLKKLRSAKGATIAQLGETTGWQPHSVRGFLSAVVRKKLGLTLVSEIGKDGVRRYRIEDDGTTAK